MNLVSVDTLRDLVLSRFFVAEGKLNPILKDIPQAVAEMYARAKHLRCGVTCVKNEHRLPKSTGRTYFEEPSLTVSNGYSLSCISMTTDTVRPTNIAHP